MPGRGRLLPDVAAEHLLIEIRRLRPHGDGIASRSKLLQGYGRQLVEGEAKSAWTRRSCREDHLIERVRGFRAPVAARTFVKVGVQADGSRYLVGYSAQSQHYVGGVTLRRE